MCKKKGCVKGKGEKTNLSKSQLHNKLKFYKLIYSVPNSIRCDLIPYLNNDATDLLCEAVYNTIHVNLGLKGKKRTQLIKELKSCRSKVNHICNKKVDINKRRKYLQQEGGFLGALLGVVIPAITSLIAGLTRKS